MGMGLGEFKVGFDNSYFFYKQRHIGLINA